MAAKSITEEYVADLCRRIGEGEAPKKNRAISAKEFTRRMLPHLKGFLDKGYTYKEIAEFFGHVPVADLKKAIAKDVPENKPDKNAGDKEPAKAVSAKAPVKVFSAKAPVKTDAKGAHAKKV